MISRQIGEVVVTECQGKSTAICSAVPGLDVSFVRQYPAKFLVLG